MKNPTSFKFKLDIHLILLVAILLALVMAGFVAYQYREIDRILKQVESENVDLVAKLQISEVKLQTSEAENQYLWETTQSQKAIIDSFSGQIEDISSTVGDLDKLAKTDEELLKKYSKVYFLNENYIPQSLTEIDKQYTYSGATGNFLINTQVWPHLKELLEDANDRDVSLLAASAYRSFRTQAALKGEYKVIYGSGANQFSADQGYSEHQLGTALDFTSSKLGAAFNSFAADPAYKWLQDNAYKYGFVLSYPKENAYYQFEPWHWRYVGVDLATHLHDEGKFFYDLSQREIDEYLIKLFD